MMVMNILHRMLIKKIIITKFTDTKLQSDHIVNWSRLQGNAAGCLPRWMSGGGWARTERPTLLVGS